MTLRALLILLATLAFVITPFFSSFNGFNPENFRIPQVAPQAQPAGYAFSIWGVIYLWLLISAVWGLWEHADNEDWDAPRRALLPSLLIGAIWLFVAARSPLLATLLIWIMLLTALAAFHRSPTDDHRWTLQAPLGLYAGWLTAASWVSVALVTAGWGLLSETYAAWLALIGATITALGIQASRPLNPEYGIAVIWALIAITVKEATSAPIFALAAAGAALCLGALALWSYRPNLQFRR